ncbi:diguanylate cyclase [Vibrio ponticus]|nr:diguanylate cyclase [Vibrio ponticus]
MIIQLAKQLKVNLIAEGVENESELQKLAQMGCNQIQGYYFSRPEKPVSLIQRYRESSLEVKRE